MRYAVLSDIHGNLEALEAAFSQLESERIDCFLFLGDLIGYGANPNECLELIEQRAGRVVVGNHEQAVFDEHLASCFNEFAYEALEWTRAQLEEKWRVRIREWPLVCVESAYSMAHGSFHEPDQFHYLFAFSEAVPSFERLRTPVGWIGHTHVPQIFRKGKGVTAYLPEGTYRLEREEVYLINPGSVGQPRDRDPRLALAVFDEEALQLKLMRIRYNNRKAADKIRKAGLPDFLAYRLL